ncbi:glycine betaine/proline transport system permease protein [Hoeflea marina]|uniref:Glycine betaine/proline transport system permease protein n=1 Tax=Hoeflea marina TaxID=274592 RepID=A0A317PQK7_9HYPH|nr:glycine betaine/proline transport system permease protein [Hoeflea marina]
MPAGMLLVAFALVCVLLSARYPWLVRFPAAAELPVAAAFNMALSAFEARTESAFKLVSRLLTSPMSMVRTALQLTPWSMVVLGFVAMAWRAGGIGFAAFVGASLLYVLGIGLWEQTMNSLALVILSVPISIIIGFGIGYLAFASKRAERLTNPLLDILQTVPAFAYLLPLLLLFGFGPVVGLIASIVFAFPAMVRNTMLGLRNVPSDILEAGEMAGATGRQLFWQVRIPSARYQLLVGVNQTTMAALSMVIIASIIGGTNDIGWTVLSAMRKADFGSSILAGIVIALLAMILDRLTAGFATRAKTHRSQKDIPFRAFAALVAAGLMVMYGASTRFDQLAAWPADWIADPSESLNRGIEALVLFTRPVLDAVKTGMLFFVMLPLKIGLQKVVGPASWGFQPGIWHVVGYVALAVSAASFALLKGRDVAASAILLVAILFYVGLTGLPWPVMVAVVLALGYRLGGLRLVAISGFALGFLLLTGSWQKAMLSVYLGSLAVILSFAIGSALGVLASENETFSRLMRPVNDTMQTMPQFVLLIPVVMLFAIGDFTALIAIIFYAYVPAFRYAEAGLRQVDGRVVEAATSLGTTRLQRLVHVKLPLAIPNLMLGLNQTIVYGIGMLVIAALVGTSDLGQEVYIGLSAGNFGQGMVAGLGMAAIAMLADSFCKAWQRHYRTRIRNG